jgi:hypothetical protein
VAALVAVPDRRHGLAKRPLNRREDEGLARVGGGTILERALPSLRSAFRLLSVNGAQLFRCRPVHVCGRCVASLARKGTHDGGLCGAKRA